MDHGHKTSERVCNLMLSPVIYHKSHYELFRSTTLLLPADMYGTLNCY